MSAVNQGEAMTFNFTLEGEPVPYTRTTQRQKYVDERWLKYARYKVRIQRAFIESIASRKVSMACGRSLCQTKKPLSTGRSPVRVHVDIFFGGYKHGDPDNVVKGILDAVLVNDKFVIEGNWIVGYDFDNPRVVVKIEVNGG